jgi:hypothetical protein
MNQAMTPISPSELRKLADSYTHFCSAAEAMEMKEALRQAADELEAARRVVEASRKVREFYPGGKMFWFSQFTAFEEALAAYDRAIGKDLP